MTVVIDASVAMKWLIDSDESGRARGLIGTAILVAPDLIMAEVANALWRYVAAGQIPPPKAAAAMTAFRRTLDRTYPLAPLADAALAMAGTIGHTAYDCFYVALAEDLHATVVTADRRLITKVAGTAWQDRIRSL